MIRFGRKIGQILDPDFPDCDSINVLLLDFQEYFSAVSFEAQDLIQNLLRAPPNRRFSLEMCRSHTWLQTKDSSEPSGPSAPLDTDRLQNFISRRRIVATDVKLLPKDIENSCVDAWNRSIE